MEPDVPSLSQMITIDRASPIPLYFQVARRIEELIESGELAAKKIGTAYRIKRSALDEYLAK